MAVGLRILAELEVVPSWPTSLLVLATLGVIFAASWRIFWTLVARCTTEREQVALLDWGKQRGFRPKDVAHGVRPAPFDALPTDSMTLAVWLEGRGRRLLRIDDKEPSAQSGLRSWNLLVVGQPYDWPTTGLRPVGAKVSVLDLFSLASFPLLGNNDRFMLFGGDAKAAAALSRSATRGLLPSDVGLLLHKRCLILDFSDRPFDTVEFDRMTALAAQLARFLPDPNSVE